MSAQRLTPSGSTCQKQNALAPALCQLAVVQALRRYEYEELREILLLATKHGLPPVLLRDRATDILLTVAACAAL